MTGENLARLRRLLYGMEVSTGLADLSEIERDVLYAVELSADEDGLSPLSAIQSQDLAKRMSRPSFFRALKRLTEAELIEHVGNQRSGLYRRTKATA